MSFKVTFAVWKLSNSHTLQHVVRYVLSAACLHINQKVQVACNFNCRLKNEVLLKVTVNHTCCKCGNISEMVQDGPVVSTGSDVWPIKLWQFQWPWVTFKVIHLLHSAFLLECALTQLCSSRQDFNRHIVCRAVPLQQLSFSSKSFHCQEFQRKCLHIDYRYFHSPQLHCYITSQNYKKTGFKFICYHRL